MKEFIVLLIAFFTFMSVADYLYVNVGDYFADQDGFAYQVIQKSVFSVTICSDFEKKTIPTMWLCMRYMKIEA